MLLGHISLSLHGRDFQMLVAIYLMTKVLRKDTVFVRFPFSTQSGNPKEKYRTIIRQGKGGSVLAGILYD